MKVYKSIQIPFDHCDRPAKMILFHVGARTHDGKYPMDPVGTFCPDHFWETRGRLRFEGKRTGVEVLKADGICVAPPSPARARS